MWFRHPPPPNRRAVAMQMVERKAQPAPDTRTIIVERADGIGTPAPAAPDAAQPAPTAHEKDGGPA